MLNQEAEIKVIYFPIRGRAEALRLALVIGNVPFVDETLDFKQFGLIKESLPFSQLPIVSMDGKVYAQSRALLRYVGKLTGTYPEDPLVALKVDSVIDGLMYFILIIGTFQTNLQSLYMRFLSI
jgi:glutathione S-transferase